MKTLHISPDLSLPLDVVTQSIGVVAQRGSGKRLREPQRVSRPLPMHEVAWAAGILEGEGTITIGRRGHDDTYRLQVMIVNTDRQLVEFFHDRWLGWFNPTYGVRENCKPAWTWISASGTATRFLIEVQPFVVTARVRRKLELALRFRVHQASWRKGEHDGPVYKAEQRAMYEAMRILNQRGTRHAKPANQQ